MIYSIRDILHEFDGATRYSPVYFFQLTIPQKELLVIGY